MLEGERKQIYNSKYNRVRKGPSKHSAAKAAKLMRQLRAEGVEPQFANQYRYFRASMYEMPIEQTPEQLIAGAERAVKHAQSTRRAHARKKGSKRGSKQREADISVALRGLQEAMSPLRRKISRLPYLPASYPAEGLREASQALQRERRKLWKMQGPPAKPKVRKKCRTQPPKLPRSSKQTERIKREVSELIASLGADSLSAA